MALKNLPVWPFEPDWSSTVNETLEWQTDILSSPSGAEQRRKLRLLPRRTLDFNIMVAEGERTFLDHLITAYSAQEWYMPLWYQAFGIEMGATNAFLPCDPTGLEAGTPIFITGATPFDYQTAEIARVTVDGVHLTSPLLVVPEVHSRFFPMSEGRLLEEPDFAPINDVVITGDTQFLMTEYEEAPEPVRSVNGPLIADSLAVTSFNRELAGQSAVTSAAGDANSHFSLILSFYEAYERLIAGTAEQQVVARRYRMLAEAMLDAIGNNSHVGAIIRQPFPTDPNTLLGVNERYAATSDIDQEIVVLDLLLTSASGALTIPTENMGGNVSRVYQVYPAEHQLRFDDPLSPAYDPDAPSAASSITINANNWFNLEGSTIINVPDNLAPNGTAWRVIYGYTPEDAIPQGDGYGSRPSRALLSSGKSEMDHATFALMDAVLEKAMSYDTRAGRGERWRRLRDAGRRTIVRTRFEHDQRAIFAPQPSYDAMPLRDGVLGVYCDSTHALALAQSSPDGGSLVGYNFWSRTANGSLLATVPADENGIPQVTVGRKFADEWRSSAAFHQADQYLYITVSASKKPNANAGERFLVYASNRANFFEAGAWFADLGSMNAFEVMTGNTRAFHLPRSAFRRMIRNEDGTITWGAELPEGTILRNFGVISEMQGPFTMMLGEMRLVSNTSNAARAQERKPYLPAIAAFQTVIDAEKQVIVEQKGSPSIAAQRPSMWWNMEADLTNSGQRFTVSDLPIPDSSGALTYPIEPTVSGRTKPKHALLMEQQVKFLADAQAAYERDGGDLGPFAISFALDNPARVAIENATPHTWVYVSEQEGANGILAQVSAMESLTEAVLKASSRQDFVTVANEGEAVAMRWLSWLNDAWPNLDGVVRSGETFYGMPTHFPAPYAGGPEVHEDDIAAPAVVLRACFNMIKARRGNTAILNALIKRCWDYLQMMWRTSGEMKYTWSPDPANQVWKATWHAEALRAMCAVVENRTILPSGVSYATALERLSLTEEWLATIGQGIISGALSAGLTDTYHGFSVLTREPDWDYRMTYSRDRLLEEFDTGAGTPLRYDTANRTFSKQKMRFAVEGYGDHVQMYNLLHFLSGKLTPVWVPTWQTDFVLLSDIEPFDTFLQVRLSGFTIAGGARPERADVMIETIQGQRFYRRLVASANGTTTETMNLDNSLGVHLTPRDITRISFINLMRLDHDSVEISHVTDIKGASEIEVTFRAAPNSRKAAPAF